MEYKQAFFRTFFAEGDIYIIPEKKQEISSSLQTEEKTANTLKGSEEVFTIDSAFPMIVLVEKLEKEKLLLEKILHALQLTLADITLIELTKTGKIDIKPLFYKNNDYQFISFGSNMSSVSMDFVLLPYQPVLVNNITFLLADDLSVIENNSEKKKQLWAVLKQWLPS